MPQQATSHRSLTDAPEQALTRALTSAPVILPADVLSRVLTGLGGPYRQPDGPVRNGVGRYRTSDQCPGTLPTWPASTTEHAVSQIAGALFGLVGTAPRTTPDGN